MSKFSVSVPHNLSETEAQARVQNMMSSLKTQFGSQISDINESWAGNRNDFSFRAMGMSIKGGLTVNPTDVTLDGDLPLAALPFKGTIEKTIKDQLSNLLRS
ncbi:MAG: polyhydroxyalkanoic acid system family protein [Methanococcaceae archaeon]